MGPISCACNCFPIWSNSLYVPRVALIDDVWFQILIALPGTIASIGILISSNNQPVREWGNNIAVSVYLSILSVIANTLLTVALAEGLVIRFWLTALRGATVRSYIFSRLLSKSLTSYYSFLNCLSAGLPVLLSSKLWQMCSRKAEG